MLFGKICWRCDWHIQLFIVTKNLITLKLSTKFNGSAFLPDKMSASRLPLLTPYGRVKIYPFGTCRIEAVIFIHVHKIHIVRSQYVFQGRGYLLHLLKFTIQIKLGNALAG